MSQIIKANINQQRQILGGELVKNHDFRDFTGKVFPETKLKVVFDDVYHDGEGTGKTLNQDVSGEGNDLTPVNFSANFADELESGSPIYKNGNVISFNGIDQSMKILAAQAGFANPGTNDFTVEGWFKTPNVLGTTLTIVHKRISGMAGWHIQLHSSKKLRAYIFNGSTFLYVNSSVLSVNTIYYYAATYDRDSNLTLYVNDNTPITVDISSYSAVDITTNVDFEISKYFSTCFNSKIASLLYHIKALSGDEIEEQYYLGIDWLWNRSGSIQKDNFKQVVSGAGVVSQAVNTLDAEKYRKLLIKDGAGQSEKAVLGANYNLQLADGAFSKASVREETYNNTIKANIEKQIIRANIEG